MAGFGDLFSRNETRYGLPNGFLQRMAQIESSLNPNAKNPNSSAGGLFQFIDSTAKNYGLSNKFDPVAATDAASRLAVDNKRFLTRTLGRDPTPGELYLAHQQGAGGASKLLSNPGAPASSVIGEKAANLNGGAGLTAGELAQKWTGKFGNIGSGGILGIPYLMGNPTGAPSAVANFDINGPRGLDAPALPTGAVASMAPPGLDTSAAAAPEAAKGLMDNKDFTSGLEGIAKAFGGGKGQQQQAESMVPLSNYSNEQAARAQAAQQMMAQLMQQKMKMPRGLMG